MTAIIKSLTHVCNGQPQHINVGFNPDIVFAKLGTGATPWLWWTKTSWVQRTQRVGATDSFRSGIMGVSEDGESLLLGNDSQANVAGQTLYLLAIADNHAGVVNELGWIGKGTAWSPRVDNLNTVGAASAVRIKRDSNLEPAYRATGMSQTSFYGGAVVSAQGITAINSDGTITVGTDANVNQLTGGAIGEGHDCIATWEAANVIEHSSYVGNSTAGNTFALKAGWVAFEIVADAASIKAGFKTKDMPAGFICAADSNVYTDALSVADNIITFGSNNVYNTSATTYHITVFYESNGSQTVEKIPRSATKKAVVTRGASTANVNCGTSDTLSMAGAFSLEWWGVSRGNTVNSSTTYGTLMARSNGTEGRADSDGLINTLGTRLDGTWSWGILTNRPNDLGDWAGNQFIIITTNYNNIFDNAGSENNVSTKPWRTGIMVPKEPFHAKVTHNGLGKWCFYLNGKLVKQRNIDMTGVTLLDDAGTRVNAGAGTGHNTVLGARYNGSAMGQLGKTIMIGASIYAAELTPAQVYNQYRKNFLEEDLADAVAPLEQWLADNASGTSWPASVNSANNGTISTSAGVVLRDPWLYGDMEFPPE